MFAATNNPHDTSQQVITNNPFYPDITVAEFRAAVRAQDTVTDERIITNLVAAVIIINGLLNDWMTTQLLAGYTLLADVPAEQINGASVNQHNYKHAVHSQAQASLIDQYRDTTMTAYGQNRADEITSSSDTWKQQVRESVRRIYGRGRTTVELV